MVEAKGRPHTPEKSTDYLNAMLNRLTHLLSSLVFLHSFEVLGFALCLLGFALCRLFSSFLHFAKALLQSAYSSQRLGLARTPERVGEGGGASSTLTPKVLDHSVSVNSFEVTSALLEG